MDKKIGILSDTHLYTVSDSFRQHAAIAFASCDTIIHAGDITNIEILEVFHEKHLLAVHGNMCGQAARELLPESRVVTINGRKIAICHGAGIRDTIEERLLYRFPEADCIIYGHTHTPVVHHKNGILFVNPGSFQGTGPYGSPGTYAVLTLGAGTLCAKLRNLSELP